MHQLLFLLHMLCQVVMVTVEVVMAQARDFSSTNVDSRVHEVEEHTRDEKVREEK